jgi:hypothetical protein
MKHLIYFALLILTVFQSCSPQERIKGKTWEGRLYRQYDDKELSEVKLKMSNDSLYLFANAINNKTDGNHYNNRKMAVLFETENKDGNYIVHLRTQNVRWDDG